MAGQGGHRIRWKTFKRWWKGGFTDVLKPLAKLAQIVAVAIAGFWTSHIFQITGAGEANPEVWVSAQTFPYSTDARLVSVRVREKNVGKVPVSLESNALSLAIKRFPEALKPGHVAMDKQAAVFEEKILFEHEAYGLRLGRDRGRGAHGWHQSQASPPRKRERWQQEQEGKELNGAAAGIIAMMLLA